MRNVQCTRNPKKQNFLHGRGDIVCFGCAPSSQTDNKLEKHDFLSRVSYSESRNSLFNSCKGVKR